jgi:hypothetical protein
MAVEGWKRGRKIRIMRESVTTTVARGEVVAG